MREQRLSGWLANTKRATESDRRRTDGNPVSSKSESESWPSSAFRSATTIATVFFFAGSGTYCWVFVAASCLSALIGSSSGSDSFPPTTASTTVVTAVPPSCSAPAIIALGCLPFSFSCSSRRRSSSRSSVSSSVMWSCSRSWRRVFSFRCLPRCFSRSSPELPEE